MDNPTSKNPGSRLIPVLREAICVVQMVLFKELRSLLAKKHPERDASAVSMLTGAVTNEIFGSVNMAEKFQDFRRQNRAEIEQELLDLARELPNLAAPLTDALRMQALCDQAADDNTNEKNKNERLLTQAADIGLLIKERNLPLPSTFMTMVRALGDEHRLIIAPMEISQEDDTSLVQ
jgi:hypothetical protein